MAKYNDVTAGQTEACINRMGGWNNFLRFIGGQGKVVFETILTPLRTVRIPAQPAITTSEEYLKEARVTWMGNNFEIQFLGLEVAEVPEMDLAVHKLMTGSLDLLVLAELGSKAETAVSQFYAFLAANRGSSEWFICYLKGKDGNLWAVYAGWDTGHGGWGVEAYSVERPDGWSAGGRILSQV